MSINHIVTPLGDYDFTGVPFTPQMTTLNIPQARAIVMEKTVRVAKIS